jgi:hypothetical protein
VEYLLISQWRNPSLPSVPSAPQITALVINCYTLHSLRDTEFMISLNIHTVNLKSYVSESECISILKQRVKNTYSVLPIRKNYPQSLDNLQQ